jgi:hypothetical protein
VTISDAFAAPTVAAMPDGSPKIAPTAPQVRARMRARGYRSPSVKDKLVGLWDTLSADLRSAWWTPTSLPTVARAWSERMPDRAKVPGDSRLFYGVWVLSNHTVGLLVPAAVTGLVGALTPLVWAARHPARLLLAASIVVTVVALISI